MELSATVTPCWEGVVSRCEATPYSDFELKLRLKFNVLPWMSQICLKISRSIACSPQSSPNAIITQNLQPRQIYTILIKGGGVALDVSDLLENRSPVLRRVARCDYNCKICTQGRFIQFCISRSVPYYACAVA